jgi:putative transposase
VNKAYKFKLNPNKEQQVLLNKTFGCARFVYNKMLAERISLYEKLKDNKEELKQQQKLITPAKYKPEFTWLKEVDLLALANCWTNLNTAYANFFREKKVGFPKFKSKHKNRDSYTTNNQGGTIRILDNTIKLPKLGFVNFVQHREIQGNEVIKSCTVSKSPSGKYYVSVLVEYNKEITKVEPKLILGLDMDMKELYTDSQGNRASYPRFYRKMQAKLARQQRLLSKCLKGSKNRNKQRIKVAKIHEKIANQRKDFLHKLSRFLVENFDMICIEDLNMQAMSQCLNLGKSVCDNSWGMFTTFLKYKLGEAGKTLVKIDKWFPSSKTCSACGNVKEKLELSERAWACVNCGAEHNRDYNAALNIRAEGIKVLQRTLGTRGIACECLGR